MAVPRTSVEPPRTEVREEPRQGLSVQTLIVAATASGAAAVIVSQFWEQGTILASAMTPVVVAIISELVRKPVESDRVRGSVRAASSFARPRSGRTPTVMAPPTPGIDEGLKQREQGVEAGPVKVYSSGSNRRPSANGTGPRRKLHLKIAVITGLIAFLIAAAALTLPELIFGGSVGGGDRNTTYFGGGSDTKDKGKPQDGNSTDGDQGSPTQPDGSDSSGGDTSGGADQPSSPSGGGDSTTPETQPPDSQQPAPAPSEPAPPQSPVPSTPTP